MKKVKLKERVENAVEAFFDNENLSENNSLTISNESSLLFENHFGNLSKYLKTFLNILRQVFLYYPGVGMVNGSVFFLTVWHTHGTVNWGIVDENYKYFWVFGFLGVFLTVLGIGDIRNPKHFMMPASVAVFSFIVGILLSLSGYGELSVFNLLSGVQIPFVLTLPFIVRMWLEKDDLK